MGIIQRKFHVIYIDAILLEVRMCEKFIMHKV
jgi:hypothetical protein